MKKINILFCFAILLGSLIFGACTKEKAPTPPANIITADCPDTIKFTAQILPMISANCASCHDGSNQSLLSNHNNIADKATSILGRLDASSGALMPQGGPALNDSLIQQFKCWISQGKMNN